MAQKIRSKFLFCFVLLVAACAGGNGTEVGNPGTTRIINGTVPALTGNALMQSVTTSSTSCPEANGLVSVVLSGLSGAVESAEISSDGTFTVEIDRTDRYEILFEQNGETCGYLAYAAGQNLNGLRVTLGRGTQDIALGQITDLGNGIFVPEQNPSSFCDDDDDDVSDDLDDDDDGDGFFDDDEDFDGYLDWFDDDDDGDGTRDEEDDDHSDSGGGDDNGDSGTCEVAYIYPSMASGLELESDGVGEIEVFMSDDITDVDLGAIQILNESGQVIVNGLDEEQVQINEGDQLLQMEVELDADSDYTLVIPAGAISCTATDLETNIQVDFSTLADD